MFSQAFDLLNDKDQGAEPESLAQALLLLNNLTKPQGSIFGTGAAVNATASAQIFKDVFSDMEQTQSHLQQKNAIADILKDQFGFVAEPKTGDPHGWKAFPLRPDGWSSPGCECFHGTTMTTLAPILVQGLKKPKSADDVAHGQAGSTSKQTIYLSPSWHYSAHPVYSPLHIMRNGSHHLQAVQMVLKCEVQQGGYTERHGTLGNKHWDMELRIDPDRDTMEGMEFLVEEEGQVRIKEVMLRTFGHGTDPRIYGELPPRLSVKETGSEFEWTKMLQNDFRRRGLFLRDPAAV